MTPESPMRTLTLRLATLLAATCLAVAALAADKPYDEAADARADVQRALADARGAHKPVLIVFGANWCEDCRALDAAFKTERNAALLAREFRLVKVDVGEFDRNLEIARAYGDPIKRGIPAAVIVSPDNRVLYATRAGELSNARRMNPEGVYGFFRDAAAQAGGTTTR
jgi:protein disulfide-isomerase